MFQHIEQHRDRYVTRLRQLCRHPSVSAQKTGIAETVDELRSMFGALGLSVRMVVAGKGQPVVAAERRATRAKAPTLLFYNHYDVQPVDPLNEWKSDPFAGEIRDGQLFARGAADDKGYLAARLCAIESVLAVEETLPVHVKFAVEGEEEIGSPYLGDFIRQERSWLRADACVWEGGDILPSGRPEVYLGMKGMQYVELAVETARADTHSMNAPLVPNPAWRLIWALATMKDAKERILIDGFYDDVEPPSKADLGVLRRLAFDEAAYRKSWGIERFAGGRAGLDAVKALYFSPTCNIAGFDAGYKGPGSKTVNPREARVKIDFRLVPRQRPARVLRLLRQHLKRHGFADIKITPFTAEAPARTAPSTRIAQVNIETARQIYGVEPEVVPMAPGTGPAALFIDELHLPFASGECVGRTDAGIHGPNEHIRLDDYMQAIKHVAAILLSY